MSFRVGNVRLLVGACALAVLLLPYASATDIRATSPRLRTIDELVLRLERAEREQRKPQAGAPAGQAQDQPRETLLGSVKQTDSSGLVTLDVGSRSGLERGNTLEVYSAGPHPKWLGTIRLLEVRPGESVGTPVRRPLAPMEAGARVSGRQGK